VIISPLGFAVINLELLEQIDHEIKFLILSHVLKIIGSGAFIRADSINDILYSKFKQKRTLNGCCMIKKVNNLICYKEILDQESVILKDGMVWDNRFKVRMPTNLKQLCSINYLKNKDFVDLAKILDIKRFIKSELMGEKEILFTLPVIKRLEKIVSAPHIGYCSGINVSTTFEPNFTSKLIHFV
jgi:hypothetical protein